MVHKIKARVMKQGKPRKEHCNHWNWNIQQVDYIAYCVCVSICSIAQSCATLCHPTNCSLPGSSVYEFPRQEYWSGLPLPSPEHLPDPGIEPTSLASPALAGRSFTTVSPGKHTVYWAQPKRKLPNGKWNWGISQSTT